MLDLSDIANLLNRPKNNLIVNLTKKYDDFPKPAQTKKQGGLLLYSIEEFEQWLEKHPDAKGKAVFDNKAAVSFLSVKFKKIKQYDGTIR